MEDERLRTMAMEGASVREIALALGVSPGTVRRWLTRTGLRTVRASQREAAARARAAQAGDVDLDCPVHGLTRHRRRPRGSYACLRCRAEAVVRRRRAVKAILIAEAGGCCACCGYDAHPAVLQFHHRDPTTKRFAISSDGVTRSLERSREEARKCVLLCANCHAEVEAGVRTLATISLQPSGVAQLADAPDC